MSKLLTGLREKQKELQRQVEEITNPILEQKRAFYASEERKLDKLIPQVEEISSRVWELVDKEIAEADADKRANEIMGDKKPVTTEFSRNDQDQKYLRMGLIHSTIYNRDSGNFFMQDLARATMLRDGAAQERLNKYQAERRALSTTDGAGGEFVPPLYLIEDYIHFARPGRPFAEILNKANLPGGTDVINVPKIATGTAVGLQASGQNSGVLETDLTDTLVSSPVITLAGQQTVSLQMLEQSPIPIDTALFEDLSGALGVQIDQQVLNGSGSGGNLQGIITNTNSPVITWTSTTPNAAQFYGYLAQGVQQIQTSRFRSPTHVVMHPRRWAWLAAQTDSSGRPLIVPQEGGSLNSMGQFENGGMNGGMAGSILGMRVVLDASIPINQGAGTNQDVIILCYPQDGVLYERPPTMRALPQTYGQNLSMLFQIYEYLAFINRHPESFLLIEGTGLVTPTFS